MPEELEHRPRWAPHVVGRFAPRVHDPETGEVEPQVVRLLCEKCRDEHQVVCVTGRPREHVGQYALMHLHCDPMGAK